MPPLIALYPNSADSGHTCAAYEYGVSCWGSSADGVLSVPSGLNDVIDAYAGWNISCALQSDGLLFCWGDSAIPEYVSNHNIGSITQVEGRYAHICVRNESFLHCGGKGALLLQ
ncbi:RCC1 domain-containing protein [Teredinibacter franksiae]|uniref:RCC1 domain-containing protein n=1 Tax=Teredinibacter franksiae TaxID=2761453 RepID=UPI0016260486|nr:RCC1 domain-containing protein [Teredinibacter franksiae]